MDRSRARSGRSPCLGPTTRTHLPFGALLAILLLASFAGIVTGAPDTTPPVANAGPDQVVNQGAVVTFDGSASTDNVGIVNYTWTLPTAVGPGRRVVNLTNLRYESPLFDPVRPLVYLLSTGGVAVVNLTTGNLDRTFAIAHAPSNPMSFAISPSGSYLVVGIPTGQRGYYYFGPYQSYLATFDLRVQQKLGEFFVDEDVARTAVTSSGYAFVAGGSGQWASLRMLDVRNGTQFGGRGTIWQYSSIALHPNETRLYSIEDGGLYPPDLHRIDFDLSVGIKAGTDWPYHGAYPGSPLWVSQRLIVLGGGTVVWSRDNPSQDMISAGSLSGPFSLATFSPRLNLIATASNDGVAFHDLTTFAFLGWGSVGGAVQAMIFRGSELLVVVGTEIRAVSEPRLYLYGVRPTLGFLNPGVSVATLTVRDAAGNSGSDTVTITVRDTTPPVAVAGPDQTVVQGTSLWLDGSASTDNVGIVSYTWTFVDGSPRTLLGPLVTYTFGTVGQYVVTLTVADGANNSATARVNITVNRDPVPPVARAGPDRQVYTGALVTFDGTGSSDNLGVASYTWTFTDGTLQTLYGPHPSYRFESVGSFLVSLVVSDLAGNTASDRLTVGVRDLSLVEYNRPAALRLGIPQGWNVSFGGYFPSFGPADLMAFDSSGGSITVVSRFQTVEGTDAFLLATASSMITDLRSQYGYAIIRGPDIRETAGAHAAVFEINALWSNVFQMWAVFASPAFGQVIVVVGSTTSASSEAYRPVFDSVIHSAVLVVPPDPVQNMVVILVSVLGLTIGGLVAGLLVLRYRAARHPSVQPALTTPTVAPPPPVVPSPAVAANPAHFCGACGAALDIGARFCGRCGRSVGP